MTRKGVVALLAAGLLLGASAGRAEAVELTANGTWEFGWSWMQGPMGDTSDTFKAKQRLRTQFNFIASENLKGVLQVEIGDGDWGGADGFAMGNDGVNIKVRFGYVDWVIPGADVKVRMGLQPVASPAFTFNNPLMSDLEVAALALNYQFNDMVGVSLAWMRPYNDDTTSHDTIDLVLLSVPVVGEGWQVNPYAMYGTFGRYAMAGVMDPGHETWGSELGWLSAGLLPAGSGPVIGDKSHASAWWLGLGGELTLFDPFRVALDFAYGSVDFGDNAANDELKRRGWVASAEASYTFDAVTPMVGFWYASGDNSNIHDGSERIPVVYPSNGVTNFGFDGGWYDAGQISTGSAGKWGVTLQFNDIGLVEALKHDLRATYVRGTNNRAMAAVAGGAVHGVDGLYLTTGDSAGEFDFDTKYEIYKNLAMHVELSYIKLNLDEAAWGAVSSDDEKAYKAGIYLTYDF